ncbi:efflux RND transporter permease subunit [Oceanomicrobium pacificus]|uniref:Efflux pump membrane transporter n=1 Tax=Oceanomicrobium pacificus TaxID=2692916 RepID=A0A6B0TTU0_9RHOB|nr:efflux RND transporter permease subunit [Oceanomicrobium pacificus]MXU64373.1 efflux RND transporter permease subunit [Oceanomicrobium pacificus]
MGPSFFIRRPKFAFVISMLITLFGVLSLVVMPVDQYPDIAAPKVLVKAVYPGADAQTILDTVGTPIEDRVNGTEGMVYMSSKAASDGTYTLTVTFELGTDPDLAKVDVQNRVASAEAGLPPEVRQRGIQVFKSSPDMLMVVNIVSPDERFDGVFLSNFATINVEGELGRVPGVGVAEVIGALDYGLRAWIDPLKLANHNLTIQEVVAAIQEQNAQAAVGQFGAPPLPDDTQFQYVLTSQGRVQNEEQFGDIILSATDAGSVVRLRDVARIELGAAAYKGYGEVNNAPGVLLAIYKISGSNSLEVAESVREKMEELKEFFPEGVDYIIGHDTTLFIEVSLEETILTMFFTIALVIAVTYLFLGTVRATLIPTIAVPVSILGALAVLFLAGMTINTVTLFALILAIAIVVDDAIIVVENVERIMHEDPSLDPSDAVGKAMSEVTGPIVATSLVLVAVFGPTLLLPGLTGRMFSQFGATLTIAVLISMVNALTLSPALARVLMRPGHHKPNIVIRGFNAVFARITDAYAALVDFLCRFIWLGLAISAALFAALYLLFTTIPSSFIPTEDKGFFMVDVQLPSGASLNRTEKVMDRMTEMLGAEEAVENVLSVNGFSLLNKALQSNAGMIIVKLKPWDERVTEETSQAYLQQKYQGIFGAMPEAQAIVFGAPAIPGLGAVEGFSFVLEDTQGRPPEVMEKALGTLVAEANATPEITRAFSTFRADAPQFDLQVDRVRAKTLGVRISDIFLTLQAQLGALYVNDFNLFGQTFRVMLQADSQFRQDERALDTLYLRNAKGEMVPISALVRPVPKVGPDVLYRYNTYNSATINGSPDTSAGFSSGAAMDKMEEVARAVMPDGFKFEWTGSSLEERASGAAVPIALGLSLVFTFLFLAALYESFLTPVAVLLTVPFAVLGALATLMIAGAPLSLYGQIGLLMLIALAAKTAILIVEFGKQQREAEGLELHAAAMQAARLRFRPVMMTVLAFAVGVFPLVIATGAGSASRVSLGLAVFGGSIASAVAGSIFGPVFFKAIQGLRERLHGGPTPPVT